MHMTNAFLELKNSERFLLALAAVLGDTGLMGAFLPCRSFKGARMGTVFDCMCMIYVFVGVVVVVVVVVVQFKLNIF